MDEEEVIKYFNKVCKEDTDDKPSEALAAIKTLLEYIRKDSSETVNELSQNLRKIIETLTQQGRTVTSIDSACQLFQRFITLTALDHKDFGECKKVLCQRGHMFLENADKAKAKIAKLAHRYIPDGSTILVHSYSKVICHTLLEANKAKKRFQVYITQSCPDNSGEILYNKLNKEGIPCTLILDSAVGYIMEKVDLVLVGAEGVAENGGIINKIGTFTLAVCAKAMKKPLYVLAESFKFIRLYPLNQDDFPSKFKYSAFERYSEEEIAKEHPKVDYTPPSYITLLFTDLGILTTFAVSDEIIKLYE